MTLPLYRQQHIFARRHQVHLPRQTLARWVELSADWLNPIYETIRTGVLGVSVTLTFIGNDGAGDRSAILHKVIESC